MAVRIVIPAALFVVTHLCALITVLLLGSRGQPITTPLIAFLLAQFNLLVVWVMLAPISRSRRLIVFGLLVTAMVVELAVFLTHGPQFRGQRPQATDTISDLLLEVGICVAAFCLPALIPWAMCNWLGWRLGTSAPCSSDADYRRSWRQLLGHAVGLILVFLAVIILARLLATMAGIEFSTWRVPPETLAARWAVVSLVFTVSLVPLVWAAFSNFRLPAWIVFSPIVIVLVVAALSVVLAKDVSREYVAIVTAAVGGLLGSTLLLLTSRAVGYRFQAIDTSSPISPGHPESRRLQPLMFRVQFNLRTILVLMLLLGVPLAWITSLFRAHLRTQQLISSWNQAGVAVRVDDGKVVGLVDLDGQKLDSATFAGVGRLKDLQSLSATHLDTKSLGYLAQLRGLKSVSLRNSPVDRQWLEACASARTIVRLDLSGANLGDADIDALRPFAALETLSLMDNPLTDASFEVLDGLDGLRELDIRGTRLTAHAAVRMRRAHPSLRVLRFDDGTFNFNKLVLDRAVSREALELLADIPDLEILEGHFDDEAIAVISRIRSVRRLVVRGGNLTDLGAAGFEQMPQLTYLDLSDQPVSDMGAHSLGTLTNLAELDLSGTRLSDNGVAQLAGLESLSRLDLRRTEVAALPVLQFLADHPAMQRCEFDKGKWEGDVIELHGSIGEECLRAVARLTDLRRVMLTRARFPSQALRHLRELALLGSLHLQKSSMSDEGMDVLDSFDQVRELNLTDTNVTVQRAQAFADKHAKMQVAISEPDGAFFGGTFHLRGLLDKTGWDAIEKLPKLKTVELTLLRPNLSTVLQPLTATAADNLQSMTELSGLRFSEPHNANTFTELGDCESIESLTLENGVLDGRELGRLKKLGRLTSLRLMNCQLAPNSLGVLSAFSQLSALTIQGGPLDKSNVDQAIGLSQLRELHLSCEGVTAEQLNRLASHQDLRHLTLQDPNLNEAHLPGLMGLRQLERLTLRRTALTRQDMSRLKIALPACNVSQ